jgi:hypothetical protein
MYQEQSGGAWKPRDGSYLPLRCGRLIDAFLEGEVAHFYFELTDYVRPNVRKMSARALVNQNIRFRTTADKNSSASYAHVAKDLSLGAPSTRDALAFQKFVDDAFRPTEWRTRSLGRAPLDVTYEIVFLRLGGIFRERDNHLVPLKPIRRPLIGNPFSEYELEIGATYHIQLATRLRARLPAELPGQGNAMLRLVFDPNVFRAAGSTGFHISSNYDLHYWPIVVVCSQEQRALITVACEYNIAIDRENFVRKELLCPQISLPVSIVSPVSRRPPSR